MNYLRKVGLFGVVCSLLGPVSASAVPTVIQVQVETRVPTAAALNRFLAQGVPIRLDGRDLRASLQENRDGGLHLMVMPEGANVHEAQAVPLVFFQRGDNERVAGIACGLSWQGQGDAARLTLAPKSGAKPVALSLGELKSAVYEAALPVDALGPQWRVIYQSEVWTSAGMHSFVFLEKTDEAVSYHLVRAEPVNWTREFVGEIGSRKVSLILDGDNRLVIRPIH